MASTFTTITQALVITFCAFVLTGCAGKSGDSANVFDYEQTATEAYSKGDYPLAVEQYELLVERIPKDPNFWFKLANSYAKNKEPNKAIRAYQNTLLRDTTYEKAWYNMGIIQMQQALRTFIDMQKTLPAGSKVRKLGEVKMNGLFELLGSLPDETQKDAEKK